MKKKTENLIIIVTLLVLSIFIVNPKLLIMPTLLLTIISLFLWVIKARINIYWLFILLIPFSYTTIMNYSLINFPGAKPYILLGISSILILLLIKNRNRLKNKQIFFILICLLIFLISVIRSLPNLEYISIGLKDNYGIFKYFLNIFLIPLIYYIQVFLIPLVLNEKYIDKLVKIFSFTLIFLSVFIIIDYIFFVPIKTDLEISREYIGKHLGTHGNNIANFYVLLLPFVLIQFSKNKKPISLLNIITIFIVAIATILTASRTAYLIFIFSLVFYFFKNKEYSKIILLSLSGLILLSSMSNLLIDRLTYGLEGDINHISAGRVDYIWIPLLKEYSSNLLSILFGNGKYSILFSQSYINGKIYKVSHAHNMYFDTILDTGITGLIVYLSFIGYIIKKLFSKEIQKSQYRYLANACLTSILAYLLSGFSGRSLLPKVDNAFLWIILGVSLMIINNVNKNSMKK